MTKLFRNFNILRPLLVILIIFIPLYPKFPLFNISNTYVAIRLDDIVILFTFIIWFFCQIRSHFPIIRLSVTKLFLAYYISITVSFITSILIFQTDPIQILFLHFIRRFEYTFLFFLAYSAVNKPKELLFPYISTSIATIGVIIYGLGQKYFHFPVISTMNSEFSKGQLLQMDVWTRISSTFAGHYDLAVYLSMFLIIVGGIVVTKKNILIKLSNLILWSFSYYLLTLTASRVSFFSFYIGMTITLFILKKYYYILPIIILFSFSIINSKDLNQRLLATIPALQKQFLVLNQRKPTPGIINNIPTKTPSISLLSPTPSPYLIATPIPTIIRHGPIDDFIPVDADVGVARSGEIRFNAEWPRAINAYRKNPLTGTGLGSITLATDNDYLRILGENGLLGFITFNILIIFFIYKTISQVSNKRNVISFLDQIKLILLGTVLTNMINATLIDVFEASKTAYIFWIIMGIYYRVLTFKKSDYLTS